TLTAAVEVALRTNPLTRATASGRQIADAQLAEARAGRMPLVQVNQTLTRGNNPVFVFGTLLEQGRFGPDNFQIDALNDPGAVTNVRTGVTLRFPLFDQRQTETRVSQAVIRQEQADAQSEQARQQIHFEVLKAFYGLHLARAHREVAGEAVKTAEADVKRIRDMFEEGMIVHSDLLAAEVQLSEFRQQKIQAEGDIVTAEAALNTALGLPVDTPQSVAGSLSEKEFTIEGQSELIRLALENRPEARRAALSVRASGSQARGARGEFLPRVDTFATLGASGRTPVTGSTDYTVGASVTYNLFDAGRRARLEQARAAEGLAEAEREQLANQIRFEVVRARQQFVTARERIEVANRASGQAAEALRIVQDRYQAGLTTITEVLRSETALVRARTNVLAARYDAYVGYAGVLLATGRLWDVRAFTS
ncbi:MAG TPA: TolC family protein, partial [Pyrinomonadaceae bacterium]